MRAAKAVSPKRMSLIHKTGNPLGFPCSCLRRRPFLSALHAAYLPYALLPSLSTRLLRARCKSLWRRSADPKRLAPPGVMCWRLLSGSCPFRLVLVSSSSYLL